MTARRQSASVAAMSDSQANVAEFTVSELSAALKRTVEDAYGYVRVRGEVQEFALIGGRSFGLHLREKSIKYL